ncbi:threonine ammonia-lyase [Criblamydia sequanensis]|uniref:Threonine dehydratase n=1 Tax=Candidatus Criblamydia sequanensis CRIB-18 TaxID=1437425 RepID=A0A090D057_9BACT|nr:pyridoxal-phosphate dependent enzyme [Criblamydia sequanensis]CDR34862.1 Putative threonine dehydratase [Criblamydia sequanensis CRIB-18]
MNSIIEQARHVLKGKIRKTPIEFSPKLSNLFGQPIYLKLENLQITGSFKVRGGFFYLSTLDEKKKEKGVAACSAGNHGLGIAYACKQLGVPAIVFVPKNVDQAKYNKLLELGAEVKKSEFVGYDETLEWAANEAKKLDMTLISAFDDEKIMAANGGTLASEVLEQMPEAKHFILPMGGGGLSSGFAWHIKEKSPHAKITICQLFESPALKLSLSQGKPITYLPPIDTLAGGLEGGLGAKCYDILKTRVDEIALIKENELKEALLWLLKNHQYLIEPSAAVSLASCLFGHIKPKEPTVLVLTGRNVSFSTLQKLIS